MTSDLINMQSFELPFELLFQFQIELEANLLDQNTNELEFELSRMQMKPALVVTANLTVSHVIVYLDDVDF